jgi:hypothetical protein
MALLDIAKLEVDKDHYVARASIVRASALLRVEADGQRPNGDLGPRGSLPAWPAYRVLEYIDERIAARILISDLSGILLRSPADFAQKFDTPGVYLGVGVAWRPLFQLPPRSHAISVGRLVAFDAV